MKVPAIQQAREIAEYIMVMNYRGRSVDKQTLDQLTALHRRMKQLVQPTQGTVNCDDRRRRNGI